MRSCCRACSCAKLALSCSVSGLRFSRSWLTFRVLRRFGSCDTSTCILGLAVGFQQHVHEDLHCAPTSVRDYSLLFERSRRSSCDRVCLMEHCALCGERRRMLTGKGAGLTGIVTEGHRSLAHVSEFEQNCFDERRGIPAKKINKTPLYHNLNSSHNMSALSSENSL